jgi:phosphoglycolate phosphatase
MFIVFDLDGTLIDGYAGITDALGFAMERLGMAPLPEEQVRGMVGQGLERLLEKAVGAERVPRGVALFRERYALVFHEKTTLLPDVPAVLASLAAEGHEMAVASNKPAQFSRRILEAKGVAGSFRSVAGPDAETPPKPDPTMLLRLMEEVDAAPAETVVVGDMEIDAEMASAAGCRAVLIPGGSRSAAELALVEADAHLGRLAELPDWIARAVEASRKASSSAGAERAG